MHARPVPYVYINLYSSIKGVNKHSIGKKGRHTSNVSQMQNARIIFFVKHLFIRAVDRLFTSLTSVSELSYTKKMLAKLCDNWE
jgi:hypothetical protein